MSYPYAADRPSAPAKKSALKSLTRAHWILILVVIATGVLYALPLAHTVAYPLILLSTLVHEMGHGLASLAVGGNFRSFAMHADGSGVAQINGHFSRFEHAFVAFGGLVGPAVAAAILFIMSVRQQLARLVLSALGVLLIVSEFTLISNMFGWIFVGILAGICLWVAQQSKGGLAQITLVFFAIQLTLSVFSRSDYLFTQQAVTATGVMPSDVQVMAEALLLPFWFWGGVAGLCSLIVLIFGVWFYIKHA